ncbi:4Fe-4S binding domain protein [Bremerella volcania]|uniref:4Fe-4S binding domain protein n=1 Tax=Bremerella volcania TaxID=2527984 RepID=A0A518C3X9_9BACT|nr:ferredoxin family protein [Bremerella volcania]QDU73927.1 4Fe-4S binding domain protein [Bremerella volcania]
MPKRLTVVVSQGQSNNPAKRKLEEDIVASLLFEPGIEVTIVPHLYDLKADGPGIMGLQAITTDFVVISWLYERATRWTLDRNNIRGQEGTTLLVHETDEDEDDLLDDEPADEDKLRVIENRPLPNRLIYCIDLRVSNQVADYVDEVKRIQKEISTQVVQLGGLGAAPSPTPQQLERVANPTNDTALKEGGELEKPAVIEPFRIEEDATRRWYPVIDYSRCTNCMECIDFCLFGVYGVDGAETILVEMPDNCRKGCPACSRVCPENAIIFPQHKTPTIAGSDEVAGGGLKIDLSQLFGKPKEDEKSLDTAVRERDEQLLLAGREAVGEAVGVPKRQAQKDDRAKDELDDLIDAVDDLDI